MTRRAFDGDGQTGWAHTSGINVRLCDGSVRALNGSITMNYLL